MSLPPCNSNPFLFAQQGKLIYPGSESVKRGPERPQRLSRTNRSTMVIAFGAAVTDAPELGCQPPVLDTDRILGFTLKITPDDVNPGEQWLPDEYLPGNIVNVTLNDRIVAVAPCDVSPGDQVYVEAGTGLPAATGIPAYGCTWERTAMAGGLSVIQVNTRPQWNQYRGTFPPYGIAVSIGGAWGQSILPDRVAYVDVSNIFLLDQVIQGDLAVDGVTDLAACNVDGSPVRTMANTADATMTYPPAGVPVSDGAAWGASIDPVTIPRLNAVNTFTKPITVSQSGYGGLLLRTTVNNGAGIIQYETPTQQWQTGAGGSGALERSAVANCWYIWNITTANDVVLRLDATGNLFLPHGSLTLAADPTQPLQAATKQYVDAHGGDTSNYALLDAANTFTAMQAMTGGLLVSLADPNGYAQINLSTATQSFSFNVGGASVWTELANNFYLYDNNTGSFLYLVEPGTGNMRFIGSVSIGGSIFRSDDPEEAEGKAAAPTTTIDRAGNASFGGLISGKNFATMDAGSGTVSGKMTFRTSDGSMAINPPGASGAIFLCCDSGTGGINFCNGANATVVGSVDATGKANFAGTVTATGLLVGIASSTYRLHVVDGFNAQARLETTSNYGAAVIQLVAPGIGVEFGLGSKASTNANADAFYVYNTIEGGMMMMVARTTGNARFAGSLSVGGGYFSDLGKVVTPTTTIDAAGNIVVKGSFTLGPLGNVIINSINQSDYHSLTFSRNPNDGARLGMVGGLDATLWFDAPSNGLFMWRMGAQQRATLNNAGNFACTGTITGTVKNFTIPLPGEERKIHVLTHSSVEGPEIAVYYRGEIETFDGAAVVTLPNYFEALTTPDQRSVLLTQVYDDDAVESAMLMASRIVGGQFTVRSSIPVAKVAWEVKAVRSDQPPLIVISLVPPPGPYPPPFTPTKEN